MTGENPNAGATLAGEAKGMQFSTEYCSISTYLKFMFFSLSGGQGCTKTKQNKTKSQKKKKKAAHFAHAFF